MNAPRLDSKSIEVTRRGSGRPLVLLHCLGVDRRIWDLAGIGSLRGAQCLSYDFPGHGGAPLPVRSYGIEELSEQLADLLDAEGIAEADIAGISLGGLVAQDFAARHADRVRRCVLIDTTPRYTDEMRRLWAERARTAREAGVATMTEGLLPVWFTPSFIESGAEAVRYVRACFATASGEGYALACEALAAADLRPLVPKITAPTLVVCGTGDLPSFIDAANFLLERIPGAQSLWLEPARHASMLEQPAAFIDGLTGFLGAD